MISDVIDIEGAGAVDTLKAVADGATSAAEKVAALKDELAGLGKSMDFSAAGPDKFASAWSSAIAKVKADLAGLNASAGKLGDLGAGAAGAADKLKAVGDAGAGAADGLKAAGDAGKGASAGLDSAGTSATGAADKLKGLGDSAKGAADGLKGVGDSAKESEAFLAEYNATLAETAAMAREAAAASADASARIASAQRLNTAAAKSASDDAIAAQAAQANAAKQAAADAEASSAKHSALLLGVAAAAGYGIYKAAQLQTQVTRLYTSAGESQANLPMMTQGILAMSGQTATSQSQLASGAYMIESAGFHGKDALTILRAAAQGAQAEGAPLGEVGNALTSLMVSYGMKPSQATAAMNQIITMVGSGKMTMAGAVGALPSVLPVAAKAGLSFGQVGGALATMTATGMSPDWAAQMLRHTIGSIQNPNNVQTAEMQQLGINSVALSKNLGKEGLTGAISQVETAILHHMGPAGTVLLNSLNSSKLAAQSAQAEIAAMPPSLRSTAQAFLDNGISTKQFKNDINALPPLQANLLKQFQATADAAHGFNNNLKAGGGNAQTFAAALSKAMGGTVGLQTALMLGGTHMSTFQANAEAVSAAAQHAGSNVKGWADIQKTFNFQLHSFQYSAEAAATSVGAALLPAATGVMKVLSGVGGFLASNPALTKALTIGGGALGASYLLQKAASPVATALQGVGKVAQVLHIPGLDKLAGIGQNTGLNAAATALDGSAEALNGAAEALSGAAGKLDVSSAERGVPGAVPGGGKVLGVTAAIPVIGQGIIAGLIAKAIGDSLAPAGTQAGKYSQAFQQSAARGPDPASQLHPYFLGGFEGWLTQHIGSQVGGFIDSAVSRTAGLFSRSGTAAPTLPSSPAFWKAGSGYTPPATPPPVKVPPPDTTALDAAQAKIHSALDGIGGLHVKPVKIPPPDTSAIDTARAKVGQQTAAIHQNMESELSKKTRMAPPDLSAAQADVAAAKAIGADISAGLASGIRSGIPAIAAAAAAASAAATVTMAHTAQTRSPSRVTYKIGQDTAAGYHLGIRSGVHHAAAAAKQLTASAIASLKTGLLGGKSAVDAVMTALGKGPRPQDITTIDQSVAKLVSQVPKGHSALVAWMHAENSTLDRLANKRAVVMQEITNADQVTKSMISGASIMSATAAVPVTSQEQLSSYAVTQGMAYQAGNLKAFAQQVGLLKKMGLNATSLDQIIQAGPDQGYQIAQALTSGGAGVISQVNQLEKSILQSSGKIGNIGGPAMYQAGAAAGNAAAKGLRSELGTIEAVMKQIANSMVSALQSVLGHHGAGVHHGGGHGHTVVHHHHNVTVHVHGDVTTQEHLATSLQAIYQERGSNNWQVGLIHPGRAA